MEQTKKSKLSYAHDCDFEANRVSKSKFGLDFARNNGSNTLHLSSNMVRMNSNNATRSALKSPLKRNNGKNVSTFESSPQGQIISTQNLCISGCISDMLLVLLYQSERLYQSTDMVVQSYEANTGYNASEFKIEIHNPDIHVVTPAEFMQGCLRKMVGMIRDIEPEIYCVVYATIHSIQYENGWAYTACKSCNTKATPIYSNKGRFFFKEQKTTMALFKIIIRIFDESGSAQVVLFVNNVYKMTKLSAWKIMEEQGMDANQYFPDDLNQIIGKQYLFKIKYSQFNHNNNSNDEDDDYECELDEMNEDEEVNITSQQNEENEDERDDYALQNEKDDHTSPLVEINENVEDDLGNNDITTTNEQASEPGKETNILYIDLSDYETEDEEEDLNTTKKLVTIKLEKNP
ncbi:replication protein A 70 kDa DNA-binding subunit B [Tanacetum coccineum]